MENRRRCLGIGFTPHPGHRLRHFSRCRPRAAPPSRRLVEPTDLVKLQVAGANERDVGKSTARLPQDAFRRLGLAQGDII